MDMTLTNILLGLVLAALLWIGGKLSYIAHLLIHETRIAKNQKIDKAITHDETK